MSLSAAMGDGFIARDITFVNSAGPAKHQAVALRVGSDKSVIFRCSIVGYQDTLYTHSKRQFYRETDIYGRRSKSNLDSIPVWFD
jgi:pectin methylesterase-like acyl-CoA thioesterase